MEKIVKKLSNSEEPSIRYKIMIGALGKKPKSAGVKKAQEEIRYSERVNTLLSERDVDGKIPRHPYAKWQGAHWVLSLLADLGYPPGDSLLIPLREQVYRWLFSESHERRIKAVRGRVRRCASQEGNALYSLLTLDIADDRADELARRLIKWQWPDGGWNCDREPTAEKSSFYESLIPLRALALHARLTGDPESKKASSRAAEIFLKRRLYKKQSDGSIMKKGFVKLHYPCYWYYDILFALKVMIEAGFIEDSRCTDGLDLLESKRLRSGGFPAEEKYYTVTRGKTRSRGSFVNWGGSSRTKMNEFVTADALYVLKRSGRLD
jgi:hypothetical protein